GEFLLFGRAPSPPFRTERALRHFIEVETGKKNLPQLLTAFFRLAGRSEVWIPEDDQSPIDSSPNLLGCAGASLNRGEGDRNEPGNRNQNARDLSAEFHLACLHLWTSDLPRQFFRSNQECREGIPSRE